jgi:predicted deacetylase
MKWSTWDEIDELLTAKEIKPVLAVIPDNKNPQLFIEKENPDFWEYIREKQRQGWSIGLHGYQHVYVTKCSGILGLNPYSEFAGLPEEEQEAKISNAIEIFRANGVKPELWIAPAHSFDEVTIKVLKKHDITIISDGFALYPYVDNYGVFWVPQQLWGFPKRRMLFGVYTVLFHHNSWTERDLLTFKENIKRYKERITDLKTVISLYSSRKKSLVDNFYEMFNYLKMNKGKVLKHVRSGLISPRSMRHDV